MFLMPAAVLRRRVAAKTGGGFIGIGGIGGGKNQSDNETVESKIMIFDSTASL
jgi:hypothetical protein